MNTHGIEALKEAIDKFRQWSNTAQTAAACYVVLPALILYRTAKGVYRVRPHSDIASRGLFEHTQADLHPCPVTALKNNLAPNERGVRPSLPTAFLESVVEAGVVPLRGKHLVANEGVEGRESPFASLAKTFPSFKDGVGYMASMFSASQAGMTWQECPFVVDHMRGAGGIPCGSDGGGIYVVDSNSPISRALKGEAAQVRLYNPTKNFFAKGMLSPMLRCDVDRLYPHLKGLRFWIIIDPSQFKAGAPVELSESHPLVKRGLKKSYSSYKDFFLAAGASGVTNLSGLCSLSVMRVKRKGKTSMNSGVLARIRPSGAHIAKSLLEKNFSNWQRSGGISGTVAKLVEDEINSGKAEMRNIVASHSMMNEMLAEEGNPMFFDAMGVKVIRDQALDKVGRKWFRIATGTGEKANMLVARIDDTLPPGVVVVPQSVAKHGDRITCWRQPLVSTTGVSNLTAWVLNDPDCPKDIRKKWAHLAISKEFIACSLIIVIRFQGDNDGDDMAVTSCREVVEMVENHSFTVFEKDELFMIEGTNERGVRSKAKIMDSLVGLGRDFRGPIGIQTNIQLAGFNTSNERVVLSMMRAMQFSVDQAKKDLPNPDYRQDVHHETWKKVEVPGWPGHFAWSPSDAILKDEQEDETGYPHIGKLMKWVKHELGCALKDALPWLVNGKKITPESIARGKVPEVSTVDISYNHFLELLEGSDIKLESTGEIIIGVHLLNLIRWKSGLSMTAKPVQIDSAIYRKLLDDSGLKAYSKSVSQIMKSFGGPTADEAAGRSRQIGAAKETLLGALSKLSVEDRLTIWMTECEQALAKGLKGDGASHLAKAYRVVFLGDNEITRLLGLEDVEGCPFLTENSDVFLARVRSTMECPQDDLDLHRFGGAGAAVLNGFELCRSGDEIMFRNQSDTLSSLHEEGYGSPLVDCEVCMKKARNLLVNQYRWSPKEDRGVFAIGLTKRINELLSEPSVQTAIRNELAPHYES